MEDFVLLIGERYLNDSLIDFLLAKFQEEEAETRGSRQVVALSSLLVEEWNTPCRMAKFIKRMSKRCNLNCLKRIILPFNLQGNHWGLLVLDISRKVVYFDDGFHQSFPDNICSIIESIVKCIFNRSSSPLFESHKSNFDKVLRFGMPSQPAIGDGSSSCGAAVVLAAKDFFVERPFSWSYSDTPAWRRKLLLEIINF